MYDLDKEKREAIEAGERALASLRAARKNLNSASGWGIVDIFGGGLISGMAKHLMIGQATDNIAKAKRELQAFSKEVNDVSYMSGVNLGIGDFAVFADFFFDGMLADFYMQSKISKAKDQVDEAIRRVETVLAKLR